MINIMILCSTGISSAMLKKAMLTDAKLSGIDCQIDCSGIEAGSGLKNAYDVILLTPQARFNLQKIVRMVTPIPVGVLKQEVFDTCNGEKALHQAISLITN